MDDVLGTDDGLLDLAEVLRRLGDEFRKAQQVEDPVISWGFAEVELETAVEKSRDGSLKFYVIQGGIDSSHRSTLRVKVSLTPYMQDSLPAGM